MPQISSTLQAARFLNDILHASPISSEQAAKMKFDMALRMEGAGEKRLALMLYREAQRLGLRTREIQQKIRSLDGDAPATHRFDHLIRHQVITPEQLEQARKQAAIRHKSVEYILINEHNVDKEVIGKSLSAFYGVPFMEFKADIPTPIDLIGGMKRDFLLSSLWVPLKRAGESTIVLIDNPYDINRTDQIRRMLRSSKLMYYVGLREDIEAYIDRFFSDAAAAEAFNGTEEEDREEEAEPEIDSQVVRLVNQLIIAAVQRNASDIHIEPSPTKKLTTIRFRQDGVCQEYMQIPNSMVRAVTSRIKVMARLDLAERRLPQDGKIRFRRGTGPPLELRVATLPTAGNFEDVVLRLLASGKALKLDELGLREHDLETVKRIVSQPYGLFLVVGPTGSGKTTTLHAILRFINKPGLKIWTAEDPVEITQPGLRQVEVKPKIGLTFARIMRAFLRADPDVIMIGEMRDTETASTAVEASLTGHLVFSTLHTNSAPETVTRLLDMGINSLNFSDAILGILAQRLVRRLCPRCKERYHPSRDEFEKIRQEYGAEQFESTGIKYTEQLYLYRPKGCAKCSGSGYRGRVAILELLECTRQVKALIKKRADVSEIFREGAGNGMTTLRQSGILKVFDGVTDMSEVRRTCATW